MSNTSQLAETIQDLPSAINQIDVKQVIKEISKRGDLKKASEKFSINRNVLSRLINEYRIISNFPDLEKSKAASLSKLSIEKELMLFTTYYDINKLNSRKLNKAIKKWRIRLEKDPRKLLSSIQHDLIIGSTLGDSNIRQRDKNCNLRVGHTKQQEKYLLWKYGIINEFTLSKPAWNIRTKKNGRKVKSLELATSTHPLFNFYRKLFYNNRTKEITREVLDLLTPRSLAIWVCDDGSYGTTQDYIILCTNSFTLKEHKIMKKYFNDVWNLDPTIGFRDNKYYYLRFKKDDTLKLVNIIKSFVIKSMKHKIGEKNE